MANAGALSKAQANLVVANAGALSKAQANLVGRKVPGEVGARNAGVEEGDPVEVVLAKVKPPKVGSLEAGSLKPNAAYVRKPQVDAAQIAVAQVNDGGRGDSACEGLPIPVAQCPIGGLVHGTPEA